MRGVLATRVLVVLLGVSALTSLAFAALFPEGSRLLTAALAALGVASFGLSVAFARAVSLPLGELADTVERLGSGDTQARARSRRDDEIGRLGRAIDRVAEQLDTRLGDARREEARHGAILDAMVEAVVVTDRDGRIALSNAAFGELAGRDAVGLSVVEAIRSPELEEAVRLARDGRKRRVAVSVASDRGTRRLDAAVSPLPAGAGVVVVLHDVTELRRIDAVRRDFVANASHELRTPLTSIRGYAETLEGGALSDPGIATRFVRGIVENAARLQRLVDDLLELSRAESPDAPIVLAPVDVSVVAARILRTLEPRARSRRTQLSFEPGGKDVVALAEERAVDHILMNLVENAIKYGPEGGHVWVRATREEGRVLLTVRDDGPGIAEAHLPRLFERFYRVDPGRAREQGGTGLGLSIVKHLAGRLGGDVSVESRIGKGTTFTVRLRHAASAAANAPADAERA